MTNDATSAPAPSAALSENMHVMISEATRCLILGLAVIKARQIGPNVRPREGEAIRDLMDSSIERLREEAPVLYAKAIKIGSEVLAARKTAA